MIPCFPCNLVVCMLPNAMVIVLLACSSAIQAKIIALWFRIFHKWISKLQNGSGKPLTVFKDLSNDTTTMSKEKKKNIIIKKSKKFGQTKESDRYGQG